MDLAAVLAQPAVRHESVDLGEQGVVPAHADVSTRMDPGTQLPHDDVAGLRRLAAEELDPPALTLAVPAVAGASLSLFMRHGSPLPSRCWLPAAS